MPDALAPRSPALLDAAGAAALVASYAAVSKGAALKDIGRIDVHMGRFIALSPICLVATADASGKQDVTPRGDPPGSFKVLDEHTIALADRPGNNRLDTLKNLLENPEIALIFLIPGITETVRVAGTARLSVDPELLASMAVQGKEPKCAIVDLGAPGLPALRQGAAALEAVAAPTTPSPRAPSPRSAAWSATRSASAKRRRRQREARTERAYKDGLWAPIP